MSKQFHTLKYGNDLYHRCTCMLESYRTHNFSLEGATELKFARFCSSRNALSITSLSDKVKFFSFWPKTMEYSRPSDFSESKKSCAKSCHFIERIQMALVSDA